MRREFVHDLLSKLLKTNEISLDSTLLAVCAGPSEKGLFEEMEFRNVTISNLDHRMNENSFAPFKWSLQDAHALSYADNSIDVVFVADGLHHCSRPHLALTEMYRVAKKAVIVVESRESFLMVVANKVGLSPEYEIEAVAIDNLSHSGVDNTEVPNFIYRWKERDVEKTLRSFDPTGDLSIEYYYGLNLPFIHAKVKKSPAKLMAISILRPAIWLFAFLFPKQGNTFAFLVRKQGPVWPWLIGTKTQPKINADYVRSRYKIGSEVQD